MDVYTEMLPYEVESILVKLYKGCSSPKDFKKVVFEVCQVNEVKTIPISWLETRSATDEWFLNFCQRNKIVSESALATSSKSCEFKQLNNENLLASDLEKISQISDVNKKYIKTKVSESALSTISKSCKFEKLNNENLPPSDLEEISLISDVNKECIKSKIPVFIVDEADSEHDHDEIDTNFSSADSSVATKTKTFLSPVITSSKEMFQCSECSFKTSEITHLQKHESLHPKGRRIKCATCDFETRYKSVLTHHLAMHSGKKFRCSKCSFKTDSVYEFTSHENAKYPCYFCNVKPFHVFKDFFKHLYNHREKIRKEGKFFCFQCQYNSTRRLNFVNHIRKHFMPSISTSRENSTIEDRSKTKGKGQKLKRKRLQCDSCSFTTCFPKVLKKHKSSQHKVDVDYVKMLQCDYCRFTASFLKTLEEHISKEHSKLDVEIDHVKKLQCDTCHFTTSFPRTLRRHKYSEHYKARAEDTVAVYYKADVEIGASAFIELKCDECHFVTDDKDLLCMHKRFHTIEDSESSQSRSNSSSRKKVTKTDEFKVTSNSPTSSSNYFQGNLKKDIYGPIDSTSKAFLKVSKGHNSKTSLLKKNFEVSCAPVSKKSKLKYDCKDCNYSSSYFKRFKTHRSVHLRQKVFQIIIC